jgi:hypothetical protein
MANIDFDLQDGNPAAIAVRFHVAQHSMLTYMDFKVGSARAAVEDIGNQITNVRIHGGDYGIITRRTAPVWQFLLMDSTLDGQRIAGIQTMEAGFTLVRVGFSNMPVALKIFPGEVEQLYARDLRLENITGAALEVAAPGALLLPRLTTAQRDGLAAVHGMMIFNTDVRGFEGYASRELPLVTQTRLDNEIPRSIVGGLWEMHQSFVAPALMLRSR